MTSRGAQLRWLPLSIDGAWCIEPLPVVDARGFFARLLDADDLRARGLCTAYDQTSVAWNVHAGTIRGLHLARAPVTEAKIVRCTRGAAFDVIVDARADSPTFGRAASVLIDADNRRSVVIPDGCAHGYQTLVDGTELTYTISGPYAPEAADGVRWDDPALGIDWPLTVTAMSTRDAALGSFSALCERLAADRALGFSLSGGSPA